MKKLLTFLLTVMIGFCSLSLSAQGTLTVANGSETNNYIPVYGLWADVDQHTQIIYPASLLTSMVGQAINSITFYTLGDSPNWGLSYTIGLSTTTASNFSSGNFNTVSTETVFIGSANIINGVLTFTFADGFVYSGDNLLLDLQTSTAGTYSSCSFIGIGAESASINQYTSSYGPTITTQNFIPTTAFTYSTASSCVSPNNLAISEITNNSALLSWHPRAAGTHMVSILAEGGDESDMIWTTVDDTSYTFTDLQGGIHYFAYVKTDCGDEMSSAPFAAFYTACDAVNEFPWFEGFENDWITSTLFEQDNQAPLCWSVYNGGGTYGSTGYSSGTYDYRWKPNMFDSHVYAGEHSAVCYTDYAVYSHNDWLITPLMNIPENMQVSFYAQRSSSSSTEPEEISIWISDVDITLTAPEIPASDTSGLDTIPLPGFTQIFQTDIPEGPFNLYEVSLSEYTGNRYIAFVRRYAPNDGYYLCLDNVSVDEIPSCQRPHDLAVDSAGTNFANLTWNSDASSFNLYYKLESETSYTVIPDISLDEDNIYTLTDILPGNLYNWYVEAICDNGTLLPTVHAESFFTECAPISQLPVIWDLESNNYGGEGYYPLPTCWSRFHNTYPYSNPSGDPHSGNYCLYTYGDALTMVLPEVDNSISINNLQIQLWAESSTSTTSQYPAMIEVGVISDPMDVSTFTPVDTIDNITTSYSEKVANFSNYNGSAHQLAMRISSGKYPSSSEYYNSSLYIDDITLSTIPTCPRPDSLAVSDITANNATVTWTSEENAFMVYYKVQGASTYTAITDGPVTDHTYTLTELIPNTYYQVYVSTVCEDESETPANPITFATSCVALDTLPYICDFESNNNAGTSNNPLQDCWTRGNTSSYYPYVYDYSYYSHSGSHSLYFYENNTVAMPAINPENINLSESMVSFFAYDYDAYNYGDDYATIQVGVMTDPNDASTFVLVSEIQLAGPYSLYQVPMTNYEGAGTYIAFRVGSNFYNSVYMDDVTLEALPDCLRPMTFSTLLGTTQATISWNMDEDQNEWEVVIGTSNDNPDNLEPETTTTNSYLFEELEPNTTYTVYVRTVCGSSTSVWSEPQTFTTLYAEPATLPYLCDFEDADENANWMLLNGFMQNKWFIDTAANNTIDGEYGLYVSADSGVTNGFSNNNYATIWAYRDIQFTDANEFLLSFDWRTPGGEYSSYFMNVYLGDPVNVSTSGSYNYQAPAGATLIGNYSGAFAWDTETITLDGADYANTVKRIYFMWHNDTWDAGTYSTAVDNISITEVSCARPANVELAANGIYNVTLHISPASESDEAWEVKLNDSVFTVNDTLPVISVTPGTEYEVYVRTICNDGDTSVWSIPTEFISECVLITTLPQTWDFESGIIGGYNGIPVCWSRITPAGSYYDEYPYVYSYYEYAHSGYQVLYFYSSYEYSYGIMPAIDTETLPLQEMQVSFYARTSDYTGSVTLQVGVMTDPSDASTFTNVMTITPPEGQCSDPFVVSFANYTGEGNYIAFRNVGGSSSYAGIYVDDVTLENIPSCPTPSGITISDITANSATIAWTENGTAEAWNIKYVNISGDETIVPVTTNPYTLTDLTSTSSYTVSVQASCSTTDTSSWSGTTSFNTDMVAVELPYQTDFSTGDMQWYLNNGNAANFWTINNGALFVTNNGTTPGYTSGQSTVMAEKLFTMPACDSILVEFDVYVGGEILGSYAYDYLKVFLAPSDVVFTPSLSHNAQSATDYSINALNFSAYSSQVGSGSFPYILANTTDTLHVSTTVANPAANGLAKAVFLWRNDSYDSYPPAAIISNFRIADANDTTPVIIVTDPTVTTENPSGVEQTVATMNASITNPDGVEITGKGFAWKLASAAEFTNQPVSSDNFSYTLNNLTPNTAYEYKAYITYNGENIFGDVVSFTTLEQGVDPCDVPTGLAYSDLTHSSFTVTWNANPDATGYTLRHRPANGQWTSVSVTTNSHTLTGLNEETTYEVQVQADCGNGNTSDWSATLEVVTPPNGIPTHLLNSIALYPNPAKDYVDVRVDNDVNVNSIEVYDVYGKMINTVNVVENPTRINVSGLANGMYFVRVTTENGAVTKTFVKQ